MANVFLSECMFFKSFILSFLHVIYMFFKDKRQDGIFADARKKKNGSYVYKVQNESHISDGKAWLFQRYFSVFMQQFFFFN